MFEAPSVKVNDLHKVKAQHIPIKYTPLPIIEITEDQIIDTIPLTIQFKVDQCITISTAYDFIRVIGTEIGIGNIICQRYKDEDTGIIYLKQTVLEETNNTKDIVAYSINYDCELKTAVILSDDTNRIDRKIGNLDDLTTEDKSNVVNAINEVASHAADSWSKIKVGENIISATQSEDMFELAENSPITVSADVENKKITFGLNADDVLNDISENPVQNKVIKSYVDNVKQEAIDSAIETSEQYTDNKLEDYTTTEELTELLEEKASKDDLDDYLPLSGGTMTGSISMGNHKIESISNATSDTDAVAYGQLPAQDVITSIEIDYEDDTVTLIEETINIKNNAPGQSKHTSINLADEENAGLMSPASVTALEDLGSRVESLEGRTIRLLYAVKENPTAAEIEAFVIASGYSDSTKWAGIAVVIDNTFHIWHYYANNALWKDDGVDTVSQFTNSIAGIIKGSNLDGKVYAENDGTGSINGWDTLKTRVTNVENNKADKSTTYTKEQIDTKLSTYYYTKTEADTKFVEYPVQIKDWTVN